MQVLLQILNLALDVLTWVIIAHVIVSWLVGFGVLNRHQPLVNAVWDGLNRLLDPYYARIRQFLPDTGALDLAPLVLLLGVQILRIMINGSF
ncbi:MAG: YggT family protein [Rhodobacteraceae bacterium]|nr:YggT family protein [Paracoccaceae bacterium]MCY4195457.1 YggT family protein [Paracoccaceae bacterium]MCY4327161.1 YggT family protein [Paracoccaceae bacterium]